MHNYIYELEMKVRDYECDLQGIVNNAVYQNYMEHTRHEFIDSNGVNFAELHSRGIDAVVIKVEIEYKTSLCSGDSFVCRLRLQKDGIRYIFHQDIYRCSDNKLCTRGRVESICSENGRPSRVDYLSEQLGKYIEK